MAKYCDEENNQRLDRFYAGLLGGSVELPPHTTIERGVNCIYLSMDKPESGPAPTEREQLIHDVIELAAITQFYIARYELDQGLTMAQIKDLPQYKRAEIYSRCAAERLGWRPEEER